jgi:hypothetical protein
MSNSGRRMRVAPSGLLGAVTRRGRIGFKCATGRRPSVIPVGLMARIGKRLGRFEVWPYALVTFQTFSRLWFPKA